jgi:hypothetical protein
MGDALETPLNTFDVYRNLVWGASSRIRGSRAWSGPTAAG